MKILTSCKQPLSCPSPRAGRGLGWGCAAIQKDLNIYLYIKNNSINNKSNVLDGCVHNQQTYKTFDHL